jgi:hypothetical protein
LSEQTGLWECVVVLEGIEGRWVRGVLVHGDHVRERRMARVQRLPEKLFGGVGITGGAQHEVQRGTRRVDGPVEVVPLLVNLDVRLIDAVRIVGAFQLRSTPFIEFGGIALDPAKYGGMIDGDASFAQELFDITITQSIPEVPADRAEDDVSLKVALLE